MSDLRLAYRTREDELREAAIRFHKAHPEVWEMFCRFTFELIRRGWTHHSADAVMHRVRWETDAGSGPPPDGESAFKISNNHVRFYGARFMRSWPEHDGFFRTHAKPSAGQPAKRSPEGIRT